MQYSVGVPVRNEERGIKACLESILAQEVQPENVFVCVNGSTDRTQEIVEDMSRQNPQIQVLSSEPGKCQAWNEIYSQNDSPYLMMTDGDVTLKSNASTELLKAHNESPEQTIVGGSIKYQPRDFSLLYLFKTYENSDLYVPETISGSIYMANVDRLKDVFAQNSLGKLPDVILEDIFLHMLTNPKILDSTYSNVKPVNNLRDYFNQRIRLINGNNQLKEQFPQVVQDYKQSKTKNGSKKTLFEKVREKDGIKNKIFYLSKLGINETLKLYVNKFPNQNTVWTTLKSTK